VKTQSSATADRSHPSKGRKRFAARDNSKKRCDRLAIAAFRFFGFDS
jgi:hypothetical protein